MCTNQTRVVTAGYAAIATIIHGWGEEGGGGGSTTAVVLHELQSVNCTPLNRGRY